VHRQARDGSAFRLPRGAAAGREDPARQQQHVALALANPAVEQNGRADRRAAERVGRGDRRGDGGGRPDQARLLAARQLLFERFSMPTSGEP